MANDLNCPFCSRKLGTYDGRSTIPKIIDCKKCRKRIVFHQSGATEVREIPKRNTSSGVTFH